MSTDIAKHIPVDRLCLVGGRLCLDFANTANEVRGRMIDNALQRYADLPTWGAKVGLLDPAGAARLQRRATSRASEAASALADALRLREALWKLFRDEHPDPTGIEEILNEALATPIRMRLSSDRSRWVVDPGDDLSTWLLHPVAMSALELSSSDRKTRVKTCAGETCGWVFLDESPSGRRQWCSMATCGNRAKARRFHQAKRSTAGRTA
ncbi:hypothetical protein CCR85_03940 [Rhodothalassium salexigens]|uniref:CGNR zinc finger domain-containing protein n=1 Tax=Rhodothalassium salexigens TaxID=1086 RepID=UPI00191438D6|nr:CGNR zinc finger domain-containing protein [Rhodothalassium salexigens]MBK5910643.1 hypothetical protein [Rhodothalassium salexigens]MBK5920578.1 hypothetical protein [Rhodothalassium salexigens]